jgi:predicted nucleic acid-binding protein
MTRVLVDTSVWSLALRKKGAADHPAVARLASLLRADEDVFVTGLILQEVLQAFRSETSFRTIVKHFEPFPLLELERADYVYAAGLHRRCAAKGVSASTADCQIASAAVRHRCGLLTADRDFERIARLTDLDLV